MSKKLIFIAAIVLVVCAVFIFAQKRTRASELAGVDLTQYLSAEGNTMSMSFCIDFERMVNSGLLDRYITFFNEIMASAKPEEKAKFDQGWAMIKMQLDAYGFDFKRDLKKFFFTFQGDPEANDFKVLLLVDANLPQEKIMELVKGMAGNTLQTENYKDDKIYFSIEEDLAFSFIDKKVLALGMNPEQIKGVLDSYYTKTSFKKVTGRVKDMVEDLGGTKVAWGYIYIPQSYMNQVMEADEMAKYFSVLLDIDFLFFSTDYDGKNYIEDMNIFMRNPKSVPLLADAIVGAKSIAKLFLASDPTLMEMVDNVKVSSNTRNNSIRFNAKIDLDKMMPFMKDFIKKAIEKQRLEEMEEIDTMEGPVDEAPESETPPAPQR